MPATPGQSVIIANDLRTGRSVYQTKDSQWSSSAALAEVLNSEQAEQRLQDAISSERDNLVIDPYLIGVSDSKLAVDIRERIRMEGPSILQQHPLPGSDSRAA